MNESIGKVALPVHELSLLALIVRKPKFAPGGFVTKKELKKILDSTEEKLHTSGGLDTVQVEFSGLILDYLRLLVLIEVSEASSRVYQHGEFGLAVWQRFLEHLSFVL